MREIFRLSLGFARTAEMSGEMFAGPVASALRWARGFDGRNFLGNDGANKRAQFASGAMRRARGIKFVSHRARI
ncbi:MAG: hypothetical protein DBX55_03095 [Verrucomicrobia bacterium]|nr:MAG: hypothetical protein DBX55_03095 [Verrucomicrobiota bacterium]